MTTYQKLKLENEKLKNEIRELVLRPDSMEATVIRTTVKIQDDLEKAYMYGTCSSHNGGLKDVFFLPIPVHLDDETADKIFMDYYSKESKHGK
jgi:hypothetical protein